MCCISGFFLCANIEIGCCVYHILNEHSVKIIRSCLMYPVYLFAVRKFMYACARKNCEKEGLLVQVSLAEGPFYSAISFGSFRIS